MGTIEKLREWGRPIRGQEIAVPLELQSVYLAGSGFHAFSGALLVPPYSVSKMLHDDGLLASFVTEDEFCFAYDVFGAPFVIRSNGEVVRIDPETREASVHSAGLEEWATRIAAKPNFELGASLALAWQQSHRELSALERLVPRRPFVIGGDYVVDNLVACELRRALGLYSNLSAQLLGVANGVPMEIHGWTP